MQPASAPPSSSPSPSSCQHKQMCWMHRVYVQLCVCTPTCLSVPILFSNVVVQLWLFNLHTAPCHIQAITWQRPASSQHPWAPVMGIQPVTDHPPVPSRQHFRSSSSSSMLLGNKTNVIPLLVKFTWRDKGRQSATGFSFQINFPPSLCTPFPGWHLVLTAS